MSLQSIFQISKGLVLSRGSEMLTESNIYFYRKSGQHFLISMTHPFNKGVQKRIFCAIVQKMS